MCAVPLRAGAGAGFLEPVSESESQMDLSGFFAFGAGGFLGLAAASDGFLAAADHRFKKNKKKQRHTPLNARSGHLQCPPVDAAGHHLSLPATACRRRSCWSRWRSLGRRRRRCQTWTRLRDKHMLLIPCGSLTFGKSSSAALVLLLLRKTENKI